MTSLENLRQKLEQKAPMAAQEWSPPQFSDFANGRVLGIDQSLSATGIVALEKVLDQITVSYIWKISTTADSKVVGHEANLRRTLELTSLIRHKFIPFFASQHPSSRQLQWTLAHEAPPTGGGLMYRPESSLLSAAATRMAVLGLPRVTVAPMVSPQDHHFLSCGNRRAKKVDAHKKLMEWASLLPIKNLELITNEALRDALAIALYHLWRANRA